MPLRVSTQSIYSRVLNGIRLNQIAQIRAQEQVASGRRILRPSDDPTGTARVLSLTRQLADVERFGSSITTALTSVDTATSGLDDAGQLLSEARSLLLQGMNGTLTQDDRESLATQFDLIRAQLLETGNLRASDRYLFGGTATARPPWEEVDVGARQRVVYRGNDESQVMRIGEGVDLRINLSGPDVFGRLERSGTGFAGLTGVRSGTTADEGTGYEYLVLRHDATDAPTLSAVGLALVGGGDDDTILGNQVLVIDAAAGTVRLGDGLAVPIPDPTGADAADFVVENGLGGELHLDFSGYSGGDHTGTVTGQGSISIDGSTFTAIDFSATDLELRNEATGTVLHVDTTQVTRAGSELVTFEGTVNLFDLMQGIAEDLRNADRLDADGVTERLNTRLEELDRNQDNLLVGLGVLGSRSQRLRGAEERVRGVELQLQTLLSNVQDADFAEVALDLARSELTLQIAQASGARLIQNSLLNFLQ
jgi:flagellar hook-associated protein 3 FlgL